MGIYEGLPGGVGKIGATLLRDVLRRAEIAAMSGDVVQVLAAYLELKGCE